MEMTCAQVNLFTRAINAEEKVKARLLLTLMRVSQAPKDGYEKACRGLFGVNG